MSSSCHRAMSSSELCLLKHRMPKTEAIVKMEQSEMVSGRNVSWTLEVGMSALREVEESLSDPECWCGANIKSEYQITSCSTGFWRIRTGSFILLIRTISYRKKMDPCTWWPTVRTQGRHALKEREGRGGVLCCFLGFWGLCRLLRVRRGVGKNGSTICEHRWRQGEGGEDNQTNQQWDRSWKAKGREKG